MAEGLHRDQAAITLAATYARWRQTSLGSITDALEQRLLLERLGDGRGQTVLDVGCGDRAFAIELWKRGVKINGIDASAAMIAAARQRARRQGADITFAVGTAERLPFAPATFDRVGAVTVLCFVDDTTRVLGEIVRVLRPGGRLVIGELGAGACGPRRTACAAGSDIRSGAGRGSEPPTSSAISPSRPGSPSRTCGAPSFIRPVVPPLGSRSGSTAALAG